MKVVEKRISQKSILRADRGESKEALRRERGLQSLIAPGSVPSHSLNPTRSGGRSHNNIMATT